MASNTDALRKLVEKRLEELDAEKQELLDALAELGGKRRPGRPKGGRRATPTASAPAAKSSGGGGTRRRRRKGGTRAEHAERLVVDSPGIKASEIAEKLKIKPNYMYRVMSELLKDGRVKKEGMGYYPTANGDSAS